MSTTRRIQGLGWKPDLPDHRDRMFALPGPALPAVVDNRPKFNWTPFDQGQLGSCVSNAVSAAICYLEQQEGASDQTHTTPSRLDIYYRGRVLEGSISQDAGLEVRDGLKVVAKQGYQDEARWPYDISKFTTPPPALPVPSGRKRPEHVYRYARILVGQVPVLVALAAGHPVIVGVSWFSSLFDGAPHGELPMPGSHDAPDGGHCVLLMGYDSRKARVTFLNSWGAGWGDQGYGTFPFSFIMDPAYGGDYWVVTKET